MVFQHIVAQCACHSVVNLHLFLQDKEYTAYRLTVRLSTLTAYADICPSWHSFVISDNVLLTFTFTRQMRVTS